MPLGWDDIHTARWLTDAGEYTRYNEKLAGHPAETGREDFPYYLPREKRFSIFVIERV